MNQDQTVLDELMQKVRMAKKFTEPWHKNIRRWRDWYNFKHYTKPAKPGEDRYVDPTPTNAVDLAVGILQSNEMVWHASGFKPSSKEQSGSSLVEKTLAGVIAANERRKEVNLKYETNLKFSRDGGAVIYTAWDKDIHDSCYTLQSGLGDTDQEMLGESKVFYELPLRVEEIDPLSIILLPGGSKRWAAIGRIEEVSVHEIEKLYGVSLSQYTDFTTAQKMDKKGEFIDWWEWVWNDEPDADFSEDMDELEKSAHTNRILRVRNTLLFEGKIIKDPQIMDGYDDLAYSVDFYNPASREDSSMWLSIIAPQESSIQELEKSINMRKRLLALYSGMPMIGRTRDGRPIKVDPAIGKVIPMQTDEDLGFPKWEGTPPDFDKQIELYRSRIQQSGFSDVMYGEGASSISGYALSQLGDQNRIRLQPAISHLEDLWSRVATKILSLISAFAPDAYFELYGHLKGSDFSEVIPGGKLSGYKVHCQIKPEFPNEKVRNHAMATQVAGILSARRIMEDYLGVQQSDDERTQKLLESMESHPLAVQYSMMMEFKDIITNPESTQDEVELATMMVNLLQQQVYGMGGRPQEANNPEQLMGGQTPTGGTVPTNQQNPGSEQAKLLQALSGLSANLQGQVQ